jgi:L-ascorbate metabolism protein UlaG (beta-lactamase superfamily)
MTYSRRIVLRGGMAAVGATMVLPFVARAEMEGDMFDTAAGAITVHPVSHASFVMEVPGLVIYADPVGEASAYAGMPAPDLILVTHEHGDHYNADTLTALAGEQAQLVTNPAVYDMLPEPLKARATKIANGESTQIGALTIEAVPAYNTTEDRLKYHPQGRDNGYVLSLDGARLRIERADHRFVRHLLFVGIEVGHEEG